MALDSRLRKLEALVATRGNGRHPSVVKLELRNQRHFFDSAIPVENWQVLDPGAPDSPRRAAFDLACDFSERTIWEKAERAGLRAELEALLGRGQLTPEELAAAEAEFYRPLTAEEFVQTELRRTIIDAAAEAGEPPPAWLDSISEDTLTPELAAEIEAWLQCHLSPGEPGEAVPVEQDPVRLLA